MTAPPSAPLGLDIMPEPVVALPPPRPRPSRRLVVLAAGALALVVAAVVAVVALRPPPHSTDPVVLPETLLGWGASPHDFGGQDWAEGWDLYGAVGGRGYAQGDAVTPQLNLVVVRQDVSGDDDPGDVGMAGAVEERIGSVSCTQQLDFSNADEAMFAETVGEDVPVPTAHRSESILVCWRAGSGLTVSVLVLGVSKSPFTTAQIAAAVDEVWALQG